MRDPSESVPRFSDVRAMSNESGFTLIELSIVLVIIGLIVGGVLVGQDLIRAAYVRAQISQIEKFNTAVNTFYGKYQALPGDMNASTANSYGFTARGPYAGQGDGNGLIEGVGVGGPGNNDNAAIFSGETGMFWVDLSSATAGHLIEGSFTAAISNILQSQPSISLSQVPQYLPEAKLGGGNYIAVWSGGGWSATDGGRAGNGINYFNLSVVLGSPGPGGLPITTPGLTVQQAYGIDRKIDDGFPQSGNVTAVYDGFVCYWAAGGLSTPIGEGNCGDSSSTTGGPVTSPGNVGDGTVAGPNSCYDGSWGVPEQYSTQINGGAGLNCALSFKMQGGD